MIKSWIDKMIPPIVKNTAFVRVWGFTKIPLIYSVSPTIIQLDDSRCEMRIPLKRSTKNHLGSMYFGALCIGADIAGGLIAMKGIENHGKKASLVFKDFKADFLKRPEGDVHFVCEQGPEINGLIQKAIESGQRENLTVHVIATVPKISGKEPVARFELTLSVKRKTKR